MSTSLLHNLRIFDSPSLELSILLVLDHRRTKYNNNKISNQTTTHLDRRMLGLSSQHDAHPGGNLLWLPCRHTVGIGAVEPRPLIKQHHLLRLALGVEVGHDLQRGVALDERYLHVEGAEVDAEDGLGGG